MIDSVIDLIAIPQKVWVTWPKERAMALLANDAIAMQRRAKKKVNVRVEMSLFLQLSRRIDSLAQLQRNAIPELWVRTEEPTDLQLVFELYDCLWRRNCAVELKSLVSSTSWNLILDLGGRTFYRSGPELNAQAQLAEALLRFGIGKLLGKQKPDAERLEKILEERKNFFSDASRRCCAVVEVQIAK